MPTIKDIARLAGVAQGTVSNVLNGRRNVSSEKIRLVMDACARLNYVPNERAKALRKGNTRILGVLLPNLKDSIYLDFYRSFKAYAEDHNYSVNQYLPSAGGTDTERELIQKSRSDMVSGLAVFSSSPTACTPLSKEKNGQALLYVERGPYQDEDYLGFDYRQAGECLAERALADSRRRVLLLTGRLNLSHEADFHDGFMDAMARHGCAAAELQLHHDREHMNLLQSEELVRADAVVCSRIELARIARSILQMFFSDCPLPVFYTVSPLFTMPENDFVKYELNYRLLGHVSARRLIHRLEKGEITPLQTLENTGIRSWFPSPLRKTNAVRPLNIATLDSPTAYTMRRLSSLFTRSTGIPVNITIYSYDETYEVFSNLREDAAFDIIRLDVTWLSYFGEKILYPLEEIDPEVRTDLAQYLPGTLERYSFIGDTMYALPGSPSAQVLFYRSDLFESAINRRLFCERYGTELRVPQSFDEFNRIASFFTRQFNADSPVEHGATITLGSTGVAGSEFLARLFSAQENLYDSQGRIALNSPPFVRALEQLIEIKQCSAPEYCHWWTDTARTFAQGNTAMAILYNNFASPIAGHHSRIQDSIGYAMIPGGNPVIGGGTLGVCRYSSQPQEALRFIRWMTSEPLASAGSMLGGISPCTATYENYEIVNNYPWLRLMPSTFVNAKGCRVPPASGIPFDERRFMSIIGMAVKNAYHGTVTPKAALDYAQRLFEEQFRIEYQLKQ